MSDRVLHPGEAHACFVGSGECNINAAYEIDDDSGGKAYICIHHKLEFERIKKLINEMSPEEVAEFKDAIRKAEQEIQKEQTK